MAGMGPAPKPAAQRRRRNKTSTAALLRSPAEPIVHSLPARFLDQTQAWWQDLWATPMAPEFDRSDVHGLVMVAQLVDDFWATDRDDVISRVSLAQEIRLQRAEYGLTPMARRRLQWEIERGEDAAAKTTARRTATPAPRRRRDPRLKTT